MAINPSGHIFFEDEYEQKTEVSWETVGEVIDLTSVIQQPHIWGEDPDGFVKNNILYRKGVVTVHRQVLQLFSDGYIIIAEGVSQFLDYIQMSFPCEQGPTDPFKYHLDCFITDEIEMKVLEGPHFADPTDPDDSDVIWGDLNADGSPIVDLTGTGGLDILEWLDVWSN